MTDRELQMTEQTQDLISPKLALAIANPIFPQLDSQLRIGKHINIEQLDEHAFLMDFQAELEQFYRRYHVELIRAPEGFFYLRPKASSLINRAAMSEMEMLVGKVLCYLYLSPERLAQQGIFSQDEVYEELLNLADEAKLLKAVNPRYAAWLVSELLLAWVSKIAKNLLLLNRYSALAQMFVVAMIREKRNYA